MSPDPVRHPLEDLLLSDRQRGASELARLGLEGLATLVEQPTSGDAPSLRAEWTDLGLRLQRARPSMAPVHNLIGLWLDALASAPEIGMDGLRSHASRKARELIRDSERAVERAGAEAARLIGPGKTIITHSSSSTVLECFTRLAPDVRVIVSESRPPSEGRSLAGRLSGLGIRTDFITDQQIGVFAGRADVALVGADTVTLDGSVVNKAGTRLLALAAAAEGVPLYVCFESLKRSNGSIDQVPLERRDAAEIAGPELPHVTVHNVYFDRTPASLVTAWITEEGVVTSTTRSRP